MESSHLMHLRQVLKKWNWEIFGNVKEHIQAAQIHLDATERDLQLDPSQSTYSNYFQAKEGLKQAIVQEESMLRAQSSVKWLKEVDHNTGFFHATIRERVSHAKFSLLLEDNTYSEDPAIIGPKAVHYFSELFTSPTPYVQNELLDVVETVVTEEDNAHLLSIPSEISIWETIVGLDPDSAPGPDGFTWHFFQECWDIIKSDVVAAVQDLFRGALLPKAYTATTLVLINKVPHPVSFSDLRPISLCSFY